MCTSKIGKDESSIESKLNQISFTKDADSGRCFNSSDSKCYCSTDFESTDLSNSC